MMNNLWLILLLGCILSSVIQLGNTASSTTPTVESSSSGSTPTLTSSISPSESSDTTAETTPAKTSEGPETTPSGPTLSLTKILSERRECIVQARKLTGSARRTAVINCLSEYRKALAARREGIRQALNERLECMQTAREDFRRDRNLATLLADLADCRKIFRDKLSG